MELDVLVIGAGQQGLALGKRLKDEGRSFLILEAEDEVGKRWTKHYDSLELFTPRRYSKLPGLALEGDQSGYATKDEFAAYLKRYVEYFGLPVVTKAKVTRLTKEGNIFVAESTNGIYKAQQVVVAVGYTDPWCPTETGSLRCLHSSQYKNPAQIPKGKVLVVGNGNSASQIALELAQDREVHIAMHEMPRMISRNILGRSFYWWGEFLGTQKIPTNSFIGKLIKRDKDYVVGKDLKWALQKGVLKRKPGYSKATGSTVIFDDGSTESYEAVIFATGFKGDYSWLMVEGAINDEGQPLEKRGVSPVTGLYYAGRRNQLTTISSNIYGAQEVSGYLGRIISSVASS